MGQLPEELRLALEGGEGLTDEQLRELITAEARSLGLSFEEAVKAAENGALPKTAVGTDLLFLLDLLLAPV